MSIFLGIWFVFLLVYFIFNIYGLFRVCAIRFKGDAVGLMVLIYLIAIFIIVSLSLMAITNLDWSKSIREIIRI